MVLKTAKPAITEESELQGFRDTLTKEVEILKPLSHRCLPAIFAADVIGVQPYYVCTFHPGKTFEDFGKYRKSLGVNESFVAISSLLSVLEYLHSEGRPHCDLHTKNVMIDEDVFRHGLLVIDFGSGHRESDSSPFTPNRGIVFAKDTKDKSRFQQSVPRIEMNAGFKRSDFKALGTLLGTMGETFFVDASIFQKQAYLRFCHDLDRSEITTWEAARERLLAVVDPMRKVTMLDRLFTDEHGQRPAIPLPVSRSVPVGGASLALINTTAFQSLRRLSQLSFCDWRFPGALHTRFEHSLGVFNLIRKAVEALCFDPDFRDRYTLEELKGCLLAGLLHDVGHYPLAHVVEQVAASGRLVGEEDIRRDVNHATFSKKLIEENTEIKRALKDNWGDEAARVCVEIMDKKHGVLASLLDGAVDCDKIDYLTRDAFHCGLRFGRDTDVDRLLGSFRPSRDGKSVAILESGVSGVEGLMVLQHQMLSSVYWHPTVRGIICMAHAALAHITKSTGGDKLREIVGRLRTTRTTREAVDRVLLPELKLLGPKAFDELSGLVRLHVEPKYTAIFRPIRTYRFSDERRDTETSTIYGSIDNVTKAISSASIPPIDWGSVAKLRKAYRDAFEEKQIRGSSSEIIVDVPLGKSSHRSVPVLREDGEECNITEVSHLNATIFEQPAAFVSPIRIYISPRLHERAAHTLPSIVQSAEERFHHPSKRVP